MCFVCVYGKGKGKYIRSKSIENNNNNNIEYSKTVSKKRKYSVYETEKKVCKLEKR